jgi:DNA-binding MarR family transcriptional regulator
MNSNREQLIEDIIPKMKRVLKLSKHNSYLFKEHSLSVPHVSALFQIAKEKDGMGMKDLAEQLCVTGGAVTQFIDDLVEKKLHMMRRTVVR